MVICTKYWKKPNKKFFHVPATKRVDGRVEVIGVCKTEMMSKGTENEQGGRIAYKRNISMDKVRKAVNSPERQEQHSPYQPKQLSWMSTRVKNKIQE